MIPPIFRRVNFWVRDFFQGTHMHSDFTEIWNHMKRQRDTPPNFRDKRLKEILDYAIKNTSYYQKLNLTKELHCFPIVNKSIFRQNYSDFCVPIESIPGQKGRLHIQKTSGSTGIPFEVPQDTKCRIRRIATIKAENELINFHSFEPLMHLRAAAHYWGAGEDIHYNKDCNIWYVDNANLNENKIKNIVDTIHNNQIKVVRGYVTCLESIADYMLCHNLQFKHPITFIAGGELLLNKVRDKFIKLGANVISQYANEENGIFGSSDINGSGRKINLNGANCLIEILKFDSDEPTLPGEVGRIVVTDFTNFAFPMIRYDIGDIASACEYYNDGTIKSIDNLVGRKTDMILRTDGSMIDFWNSCPLEVYYNPAVKQWQFIQKDEKEYLLLLLVSSPISEETENIISVC